MLVLIVEDNPHVRRFFQVNLRACGYSTQEADNLAQAWQLIEAEHPDLIVLDLHVGSGRGEELMRRVQSGCSRIPVMVVSGSAQDAAAIRQRVPGAAAVLMKPVSRMQFLNHVEQALRFRPIS